MIIVYSAACGRICCFGCREPLQNAVVAVQKIGHLIILAAPIKLTHTSDQGANGEGGVRDAQRFVYNIKFCAACTQSMDDTSAGIDHQQRDSVAQQSASLTTVCCQRSDFVIDVIQDGLVKSLSACRVVALDVRTTD